MNILKATDVLPTAFEIFSDRNATFCFHSELKAFLTQLIYDDVRFRSFL